MQKNQEPTHLLALPISPSQEWDGPDPCNNLGGSHLVYLRRRPPVLGRRRLADLCGAENPLLGISSAIDCAGGFIDIVAKKCCFEGGILGW